MKKFIPYLYCILVSVLVGCSQEGRLPDMRETYLSRDTKPFGTYAAKHLVALAFPTNKVEGIKTPLEKNATYYFDTAANFICICKNLFINESATNALLNYVYKGNNMFLSADYFDTLFMNKLFCSQSNPLRGYLRRDFYKYTHTKLINSLQTSKDSFGYYYHPLESYFTKINDRYCRIVGYNEVGQPNCLVFYWGKGKLFLHTDPKAFSNYFLLTHNNYKYFQQILQVMNPSPQHVYWDEYYIKQKSSSSGNVSSLHEIFKYPGLSMAFWLLLLLLLIYILFGLKRKQRIIPIIKPNQNSSVAFTETIARLYLQEHDNKNIADKMITYFKEFIRNKYYLQDFSGKDDFVKALSRKSGIPEEKTTILFHAIKHANENAVIDDYQLLSLNEQIQQFYKTRK